MDIYDLPLTNFIIAEQYLQATFRRILAADNDPAYAAKIDASMKTFRQRENNESFWELLAGISEGWQVNGVFGILSDSMYLWQRDELPIEKIILTEMFGDIDRYTIHTCGRDAKVFAEKWKSDKEMRNIILSATSFPPLSLVQDFPIMTIECEGKYQVYDGMHRTLLSLMHDKKTIPAWVGSQRTGPSEKLLSTNHANFLLSLYKNAVESHDEAGKEFFTRTFYMMVKKYPNACDIYKKKVYHYWKQFPEVKALIDAL